MDLVNRSRGFAVRRFAERVAALASIARSFVAVLGSALVVTSTTARAEATPSDGPGTKRFTLDEVVTAALANHPRLHGASAREDAATARVDEARAGFLPLAGVSAQLNRSTGNTVPGTFFPMVGFPAVAGPALGRTFGAGTWQTGLSTWASWDVLSLMRQAASVDVALAGKTQAEKATAARRLEIAYGVADAFLRVLQAEEIVKAARASVDRARVFVAMVRPLVDQNLRPGVDAARAESELAVAQTQLARAEQARDVARSQLAEAMGSADAQIDASPGTFLDPIDTTRATAAPSPASHPFVQESAAAVVLAEQVKRRVEVQYLPRIDLVAAVWLRGSGLYGSPADGLAPDVPNWAGGAVVTWSVLDIPAIRARSRGAVADQTAAIAQRDETYLAVASQLRSASALLDGAMRVAKNTPQALASTRAAEQQAVARYRAGLALAVDVADAERLLAQAEIDDALARLDVRRAALLLARAAGDLGPFLTSARGG